MSAFKVSAQIGRVPEREPVGMNLDQIIRITQESDKRYREEKERERQELANKKITANEYLSKAISSISSGEYSAADTYIDMSIKSYECPENRYIRGLLSLNYSRDPNAAISSLEYCIKNGYKKQETNILLAQCYMAKKSYYIALSYFKAANADESYNPQVLEMLGICNEQTNNSDAALQNNLRAASFEHSVKYDYSNIFNNIAYEYMRRDKLALAKNYIEKAVQYNAYYGNAWDTYGEINYRLGNYSQSVACMDKSINLSGGNSASAYWLDNSYYYRGMAKFKLNKKQEAYNDLRMASDLGNSDANNSLNTLNFQQTPKKTSTTKKRVQGKSKR